MSYPEPTPTPEVPTRIAELLDDHDAEALRAIADYAEELAEHREREARLRAVEEAEKAAERSENPPGGVPSKAGVTVKEINGNRYYYWQWREGERVKSKYKGPVDSNG